MVNKFIAQIGCTWTAGQDRGGFSKKFYDKNRISCPWVIMSLDTCPKRETRKQFWRQKANKCIRGNGCNRQGISAYVCKNMWWLWSSMKRNVGTFISKRRFHEWWARRSHIGKNLWFVAPSKHRRIDVMTDDAFGDQKKC